MRIERAASLSPEAREANHAAGIALLDHFDGHAGLRHGLAEVARRDSEWAGIPMPLDGQRLVIEPSYPNAKKLMEIGPTPEQEGDGLPPGAKIRNIFWSWKFRTDIAIWQDAAGKIHWDPLGNPHGLPHALETLRSADAWSIESEGRAQQLLGTLINHRQFRQYLLVGAFLETSKHSRLTYMFRKLRPTIVIRATDNGSRTLCALCLHPIAYYSGSWAGAMTPTDDVVAHLMLCRGDEHMFWRRANQHPSWRPAAGL